ncbi:MAG: hypothetical protein AMJ53_01010 [Gammaproteobacteria bacterium SG8_11]|nr:MAG: hypothetical protein AMJ53_01010 [Gammaproteobacteria bacterium SG8_11]
MANHSEALQLGFFAAKEPAIATSSGSQKLRFQNENMANKQEFAKVYSHSMQQQTRSAQKQAETNNPSKHSTEKTHSQKQISNHQSEQNNSSSDTSSAQSGRTLPQNDDTTRQAKVGFSSASGNRDSVSQADENTQVAFVEGSTGAMNYHASEAVRNGTAELTFDFDKKALGSENVGRDSATTTITPLDIEADNLATGPTATLQPGMQTQTINANAVIPAGQLSPTAVTAASSPNEHVSPVKSDTNDTLVSAAAKLTQTLDPGKQAQAGSNTLSSEVLRAAAEDNAVKAPLTNIARLNNELSKLSQAPVELNSGLQGHQADGESQQAHKPESIMSKERLFALMQQNYGQNLGQNQGQGQGQANSVSIVDLNKIMAQQTAHLTAISDDQATNEFNISSVKEHITPSRLPGSSFQMLSPILQMSSTFGHKGWSSEVGQRVLWMVNTDLQQAQLQLNPKHLGPIEIKITMTADQQINLNFLTHSNAVKETLDQAMPRLREIFDQSGLNLSDVNVRQESHKQQRDHHHTAEDRSVQSSHLAENMHDEVPLTQIFQSQSMSSNIVDFYA